MSNMQHARSYFSPYTFFQTLKREVLILRLNIEECLNIMSSINRNKHPVPYLTEYFSSRVVLVATLSFPL